MLVVEDCLIGSNIGETIHNNNNNNNNNNSHWRPPSSLLTAVVSASYASWNGTTFARGEWWYLFKKNDCFNIFLLNF
jgi:hypothetical protein